MSAIFTTSQAEAFLSDFGAALGDPDLFDISGGAAGIIDGMAQVIGELTESIRFSVAAASSNYTVQANVLGRWANAWEVVTARIAAEGITGQTNMVEWGRSQASALRISEAAMRSAADAGQASQAWGSAVARVAGAAGAIVGVAQIIDAAQTGGANKTGEKTIGVLMGLAASVGVTSAFGVGLLPIIGAAAVGYAAGKFGETLYRNGYIPGAKKFFDLLGDAGLCGVTRE